MKVVKVEMGLIWNAVGEVLMTLRRPQQTRPNMWEIPGGRVEDGEPAGHAVVRELKEELGVDVVIDHLINGCKLNLEVTLEMTIYAVRIFAGEPKPLESADLRWVDIRDAIVNLPCVPSTYIFYGSIVDYLSSRGFLC